MEGARQGFYDPQTWIDAAIGSAGTVLGSRINGITIIRDLVTKEGMFSKYGKEEAQKEWKEASSWEKLNRYVTNGAIQAAADASGRYGRTLHYIDQLNKDIIPKYLDYVQEFGGALS